MVARLFLRTHLRSRRFPLSSMDPWCTTFAPSLILDHSILPCMVYFFHGGTRIVHKLSRFGNASTLCPKANDHVLLDVG
ncbi:uncharacterized protein TNCV_2884731 [Trichonephila clavipes]|nr:uncharacterized protein TNCV_2884731 [Trichonephila clavipes]